VLRVLAMELRRDEHVLVLEISGPPDARPIIAELFAAARPGEQEDDA